MVNNELALTVVTNSGQIEPFDMLKIRKVIGYACEGLDVNPLELEASLSVIIKDGIHTHEIQQNIVEQARSKVSKDALDWNIVAGRAWTMDVWKRNRALETPFKDFIRKMMDKGVYKHPAFLLFSDEDLDALGEQIRPYRDFSWSYSAAAVAYGSYLFEDETIHQACMVSAMCGSARFIPKTGRWLVDLSDILSMYNELSFRRLSLASPYWFNLREGQSVKSCYIIKPNDDLQSIAKSWKDASFISKAKGGLGIDVTPIRSKNAQVGNNDNAHQGVLPWVKIYNDVMCAVDQSGKRKGSATINLMVWHNDIFDFLDMQVEGTGDIRKKSFDVFPQVGIPDNFMRADKGNREWYTFCPHELKKVLNIDLAELHNEAYEKAYDLAVEAAKKGYLKNFNQVDTRKILAKISATFMATGMPFISFHDTINARNPNSHDGNIPCVNLCTESFSNVKADYYAHTCSLSSIVLGSFDSFVDLRRTARIAVRFLDASIDSSVAPIEESIRHMKDYRTIGVGLMGMHDYVAKHNLSFSPQHHWKLAEVALNVTIACIEESVSLARIYGAYPKFKGSKWDTGEMIQHFIDNLSASDMNNKEFYIEELKVLQKKIDQYGIRNSQLCSPAPTGTTSVFCDSFPGIMPCFASFYIDSKSYTSDLYIFGRHAKDNPLSYDRSISRYNQLELVDYVGKMQQFIDTGISTEYVLDLNEIDKPLLLIYQLIHRAWEEKNKAIYYIRFIKQGQDLSALVGGGKVTCLGCEG